MRTIAGLVAVAMLITASAFPDPVPEVSDPDNAVGTNFAILIGFPAREQERTLGELLVPGTVIPLVGGPSGDDVRRQIVEKSLSFTEAAEKLWSTFRLDPASRRQMGKYVAARVGVPSELPSVEEAKIRLVATLVGSNEKTATYRIQFRQGEKPLVDSTINVARGGRAVVGGMDGAAAPYIFLFVEPDTPGKSPGRAGQTPAPEVTQPVLTAKVAPEYPADAKKDKASGIVILELTIETDGKVGDIRVLQDPDARLTAAAIEAVRQWQFQPALDREGKPVRVISTVTLNFQLK